MVKWDRDQAGGDLSVRELTYMEKWRVRMCPCRKSRIWRAAAGDYRRDCSGASTFVLVVVLVLPKARLPFCQLLFFCFFCFFCVITVSAPCSRHRESVAFAVRTVIAGWVKTACSLDKDRWSTELRTDRLPFLFCFFECSCGKIYYLSYFRRNWRRQQQ